MNNFDFARTSVSGNLVKDPVLKTLPNGKHVAELTVAVNARGGVSYLDCEAWGQLAVEIAGHFRKGNGVHAIADLRQDRWEKEGQKRSKVVLALVSLAPRIPTVEANEPQPADQQGQPEEG